MENKLISLSEYIELQEKLIPYENSGTTAEMDRLFVRRVISYQRFLKQPLTLGMFVPVDAKGNVLKKPEHFNEWHEAYKKCFIHEYEGLIMFEYLQAKEKVLFKGFIVEGNYLQKDEIDIISLESLVAFDIDHMTTWGEEIELTESALKQIGLKTE